MEDKVIRDRCKGNTGANANHCKGSNHSNSKVTEIEVLEIRRRYKNEKISMEKLGMMYGLKGPATRDIIRRISWVHI